MSVNLDRTSAKILVLGDSGVGKSSLIHLICHSAVLNSAQWTIGCSIEVKLHDNHFLEFWDIGGSRNHKIARSFLYQDYHGIILVFDATNNKSRANLSEWLLEVSSHKANERDLEPIVNINVPVITIATKKDLLPYGTTIVQEEDEECFSPAVENDQHTSVINLGDSYLYRRNTSSFSSPSPPNSPPFYTAHSTSSTTTTNQSSLSSHLNEPLLGNKAVYVNTQDVLSLSYNSKNYEMLNNFFKLVIDKRNKRFYNKFAI